MAFAKVAQSQRIINYIKIYTIQLVLQCMLVGVLKNNLSVSLKYSHIQTMESERSNRRQKGTNAFKFGKRAVLACILMRILNTQLSKNALNEAFQAFWAKLHLPKWQI